tara:strand:+ start:430 stop:648 length:219 start_codon:yes stop_codon:yes gene_type:complete
LKDDELIIVLVYFIIKYKVHSIIGWCAGLAIGMTIGMSQNNIVLGIGLGDALGASLGHFRTKKENSLREEKE